MVTPPLSTNILGKEAWWGVGYVDCWSLQLLRTSCQLSRDLVYGQNVYLEYPSPEFDLQQCNRKEGGRGGREREEREGERKGGGK